VNADARKPIRPAKRTITGGPDRLQEREIQVRWRPSVLHQNYPSGGLLPSAHYWAASSFYQLKDYGHAAELFGHLAGTWPNDAKAPDALLAEANARIEGGDAKGGRKALETLIEKYPASSATPSAKSRLKGLPPQKKK
jgi:hypothetical protein